MRWKRAEFRYPEFCQNERAAVMHRPVSFFTAWKKWIRKRQKKGTDRRLSAKQKQDQKDVDLTSVDCPRTDGVPYLPWIRQITQAACTSIGISYGQLSPVFIDGDEPEDCLHTAEALSEGLNHLLILTDDPVYYSAYRDRMYLEEGLIVEFAPKTKRAVREEILLSAARNLILDFDSFPTQKPELCGQGRAYIPVTAKRWQASRRDGGNLDIAVPIGYNTLIVRTDTGTQRPYCFDRLERSFYEYK